MSVRDTPASASLFPFPSCFHGKGSDRSFGIAHARRESVYHQAFHLPQVRQWGTRHKLFSYMDLPSLSCHFLSCAHTLRHALYDQGPNGSSPTRTVLPQLNRARSCIKSTCQRRVSVFSTDGSISALRRL